jgi:NAD(P)-dependent dehydrogenase (short-subunit alcohol dehydrogenase family)
MVLPRTSFGIHTTADEVAAGVDLHGKQVIVTDGSSGIGFETARVLANRGAAVTITARNLFSGELIAADIRELTNNQSVRTAELDLSDRRSINRFLKSWEKPVDILINNASVLGIPALEHTADGWELHFATNFLGHFELTVGLFEHLVAAADGARVVSVSSGAHLFCPVVFDDINFKFRGYDAMIAYGQSQTATILLAVAISAQWASAGIVANAVNSGSTAIDGQRNTPQQSDQSGLVTAPEHRKTVLEGAATPLFAAVSPILDGVGGRYLEDCNEAPLVDHRTADLMGVAPYALDVDNAERLWAHAILRL